MNSELPPTLTYATPNTDALVLYSREPDRATVIIHRPERRAKAANEAAGDLLGQVIFYYIAAALVMFWTKPMWLLVAIPGLLPLYGIFYGIAWLSFMRLGKPIIVELTQDEIILRNLDDRPWNRRLKRKGLYAIYMVAHSPAIWIRRLNQEMCGFLATPNIAEAKRITEFLRDAAGLDSTTAAKGP